jgi:hypothetical protein
MKKSTLKVLFVSIGAAILVIAGVWLLNWLNRPLPVSLNDPNVRPIKDVITRSHEIEHILFCDPEFDLERLEEVYIDTENYKLSKNSKLLIAKYLGTDFVSQAGYLTEKKAYFLWSRSGDPYPGSSAEIIPDSSTQIAPTEKPIIYCPDPYAQPEIIFRSIAVRDNRAVVRYDSPSTLNEAILIRANDQWFIISNRVLLVIA